MESLWNKHKRPSHQPLDGIQDKETVLIGVISDTHGLLRPQISQIFKGVDIIIHAGDVDTPPILDSLKQMAPVIAVRGNMDRGGWAAALPLAEVIRIGEVNLYVLHNLYEIDLEPSVSGFDAVISGHTHQPKIEKKNGTLFVNPGSAGPRRYDYPISVATLRVSQKTLEARSITLENS